MSNSVYPQKPVIVIVGPTASGKSDLAVKLAKKFNGEIVSADSRQVYREMDIGTGKVPRDKTNKYKLKTINYLHKGIAHYLLDVASPRRRFTAVQYIKLARRAIKKIQSENKAPIVCGGTGFYIRALIDNLQIPAVRPNLKLRAQLEKKTTTELYDELKKLDPRRAATIDRHNPRRLIRALEIVLTTGQPVPELTPSFLKEGRGGFKSPLTPLYKGGNKYNPLFIGLRIPQTKLKQRIKTRLQKRLKQGMLAEVKKLRRQGVSWKRLDSFGLEYRWLARYLRGRITCQEMITRLQKDIEHYAKRQMTWFNKDKRIHWIKNPAQAEKIVKKFLK